MMEKLTEPRRRALLNVLGGNVYLLRSGLSRTTWMHKGPKTLNQLPYNWLYEHGYIELVAERFAELTPAGRLALGIKED